MSTRAHLMTAEELFLLDDGLRHELVKGELLTMSPTGIEHSILCSKIAHILWNYAEKIGDGIVFGADGGYKLESDPDTVLAPDAAFVSSDNIGVRPIGFGNVAPDLIVEVISPSERKSRIQWKTEQWLGFGVKSVWLVRPKTRTVEVINLDGSKKIFGESDQLIDEVLPGLSFSVSIMFS